jgi:hypothetical protein
MNVKRMNVLGFIQDSFDHMDLFATYMNSSISEDKGFQLRNSAIDLEKVVFDNISTPLEHYYHKLINIRSTVTQLEELEANGQSNNSTLNPNQWHTNEVKYKVGFLHSRLNGLGINYTHDDLTQDELKTMALVTGSDELLISLNE